MQSEWYADHDNLLALSQWLIDECEITKVRELHYFFEKPWKWSKEWAEYQASLVPTGVEP